MLQSHRFKYSNDKLHLHAFVVIYFYVYALIQAFFINIEKFIK